MECDDEDNFYVVRGTPLPEIDDDTIPNRKAVQDLTVRDEKGRQRFHGAFTGGYSAGYFNTVGTKEGWEPSNFVSSRRKKAESTSFQKKPEDFMDDEDFGEFGIAPKRIRTTSNFTDRYEEPKRQKQDFDGVIPGEPPLKELVKPVLESIGFEILKRMGWRHGQGIGPRIKQKNEGSKFIGCSLGPLAGNQVDSFSECFTFAPHDAPEVLYVPKDDLHGIGYSGLSTDSVLGTSTSSALSNSTKSWLAKDKKKLSISGQAFGIGALEDDDDTDVYSRDDMSQYDFSEFLGTKPKQGSIEKSGKANHSSGILVFEGFHLANQPQVKKKQYPLPELPPNFTALHRSNPMKGNKDVETDKASHKLNPTLRSIMLGEKAFTKSVSTNNEKFKSRRSRFDESPAIPIEIKPVAAPELLTSLPLSVPPLMAVKFKPFPKDPAKQERYENFLIHNCSKDFLKSVQPSTLTEWEKQLELDEFMKTASFYQPLSKELDSRFESRSHLDVEVTSGIISKPKLPKETPVSDSIPVREVFEWHPASLLCKRFNVPNPYPDSKIDGIPGMTKKKPNLFDSLTFNSETGASSAVVPPQSSACSSTNKMPEYVKKETEVAEKDSLKDIPSSETIHDAEAETTEVSNELITNKPKPPMDLFKEIFQDSSSSDSDLDDSVPKPIPDPPPLVTLTDDDVEKPSVLNNSSVSKPPAAFGVFANLDLDALSKRSSKTVEASASTQISQETPASVLPTSEESETKPPVEPISDCYGPEPPPELMTAVPTTVCDFKHHKHKHKHHKHKEKKSKKKKKHSKHKRNSSSNSDSEDESLSERIVEKLKKLHNQGRHKK